ncbi:hypothetical protein N7471_005981 [Penicillium samsonianum]|uniref:uncharacterized protein n=1 Tax=Penicillium samsonianum TaxID=1882272 RepID=UPI0025475A0B|nr:uncharacterized protein N7471_005981 [Penicillium samsonianum]KAJ6139495.1 hypothetical protein N7471_005981 [Penicillium samsonianum]
MRAVARGLLKQSLPMDRPRDAQGAGDQQPYASIPYPYAGIQELPPGTWARFALRPHWRVVVEGDHADGPEYARLDNQSPLPAPIIGTREVALGQWSARIMRKPYPYIRDGRYIISDMVRSTEHLPPAREPMLRHGVTWTGDSPDHKLA